MKDYPIHSAEISSRLAGKRWELKEVKIADLIHDLACQQPLREGKVREMLRRGFDPALAKFPTVSERENGEQRILDGATRCEAGRRSGMETLPMIVWYELTPADESWLFAYLNKKSNPAKIHLFRSRINNQEVAPNQILDCLYAHGWELSDGHGGNGKFLAVDTAERIYNNAGDFKSKTVPGPELFAATVATVTEAWGHDKTAVDGTLFGGVAAFLVRNWDDIDDDRLIRVLSAHKPIAVRAGGSQARTLTGLPATLSQGWNIHQLYNKGLRNKLPAFVV